MRWCQHNCSDRQRIGYIDFLKFIGLSGTIVAHVGAPSWAFMLRSFDVPLLVILSSILCGLSYRKYDGFGLSGTMQFYFSRIKRLVFPTWMFLACYFLIHYVLGGNVFGVRYYLASFCLTRYGIGYVWIILIYLYSAILIPFFKRVRLSVMGGVMVGIIYCLYEVICYLQVGSDNQVFETLIYIIPYGLLTYLGYNFYHLKNKVHIIIAFVAFCVFLFMGGYYWLLTGSAQLVQIAKDPPRLYYLGYGIGCSFSLLLICEHHYSIFFDNKLIKYISMHSMWIYLWHILVLTVYDVVGLPQVWYLKYLIVYLVSIFIVMAVNWILDIIETRVSIGILKYLRG